MNSKRLLLLVTAILAEVAATEGITLLIENEKGTFGSTPDRCLELVEATSGVLRLAFDPANFATANDRILRDSWYSGLSLLLLGLLFLTVHCAVRRARLIWVLGLAALAGVAAAGPRSTRRSAPARSAAESVVIAVQVEL